MTLGVGLGMKSGFDQGIDGNFKFCECRRMARHAEGAGGFATAFP